MSANERVYIVPIDAVSISAIQDIFSLKTTAANGAQIHWIQLTSNQTSETPIRLRIKRMSGATVTQGSGGTAPTAAPVDDGDSKAVDSTTHINDTTQMTATTTTILAGFQWNPLLPLDYLPPPEDRLGCQVSEGLVLDCPATPGTTVISGFIKFSESP